MRISGAGNSRKTKVIEFKGHKIKCFHVSCQSDRFDAQQNMLEFLLYFYDGKNDWCLNGVHC